MKQSYAVDSLIVSLLVVVIGLFAMPVESHAGSVVILDRGSHHRLITERDEVVVVRPKRHGFDARVIKIYDYPDHYYSERKFKQRRKKSGVHRHSATTHRRTYPRHYHRDREFERWLDFTYATIRLLDETDGRTRHRHLHRW